MQESWSAPGYTEIRELGRGTSGRVVLAEHDDTGTAVAVKYLSDDLRHEPGFLADFRREAEVLASLDAPEVVRLWEYVQSAAGAAIVMDLVDGVSLRRMLDDRGPTAPESALWVMQGSLRGLGAAHARGVVHRDYKPANVMVDAEGRSHLTDFGVAAATGEGVDGSGTPDYMAPEQWRGAPASPATDIYATTATFVECLTGRPPFPGPGIDLLRRQHENAPIPLDDVPDPLRALVTRGLAKDPAARPADATNFLAELGAAAVAGYGADWEDRGRRRLAERAALLALLFPLAAGALGSSAVATTTLGSAALGALAGNRARVLIGAGIVALFLGGTTVATLASSGGTDVGPIAATGVNGAGGVNGANGQTVGSGAPVPGTGPSSAVGAFASSPVVPGGAATGTAAAPPAILAGIFSPQAVPALITDVAPIDGAGADPGIGARNAAGGAAGRGGGGGGFPTAGGAPAGGAGAGAGGAGGGGAGAPVAGGGTGPAAGTGAGAGTTAGSGSGAGTAAGSGSGTTAGSGSGAGTTAGSGSGAGTTAGSGSGAGTTAGSGSGAGTTAGSGSGSGAGTTAGSGSGTGSSSGSSSDDPVTYGACPGCGSGSGYGEIIK